MARLWDAETIKRFAVLHRDYVIQGSVLAFHESLSEL